MSKSAGVVGLFQDVGIPRELAEEKFAKAGFQSRWLVTAEDEAAFAGDESASASDVVALVTVNRPVTADVLARFPNLKVLVVAFTGYGVHDLDACAAAGVAVYNVPDYSSNSVAELAIGLTLAVYREIPAGDAAIRAKLPWAISTGGTELRGKVVGIYGTGAIGLQTARLFRAFGCKLIGFSRTQRDEFINDLEGKYVNREEFFSTADIVSVHVPFNKDTAKSIGDADLRRLKPSAVFINTARGGVIDEDALAACLKENRFRAGLDVFAKEPVRCCLLHSCMRA